MAFYFSNRVTNFLFEGWTTHTAAGIAGTCIAVAALTLIIELFKLIHVYVQHAFNRSLHKQERIQCNDEHADVTLGHPSWKDTRKKRMGILIGQSFLHMGELIIGYLLMLAVMSFNTWILITVALASGIGYFLFGSFRPLPKFGTSSSCDTTDTHLPLIEDEEEQPSILSPTQPPSADRARIITADVHS